jgi:DNA mismatch repair protein MSH4
MPFSDDLRQIISETLNEDIGIEKTSLGIRNQRCYAIKVMLGRPIYGLTDFYMFRLG